MAKVKSLWLSILLIIGVMFSGCSPEIISTSNEQLDAASSYLELNTIFSKLYYTYVDMLSILNGVDGFETIEEIEAFETEWVNFSTEIDGIVEILSSFTPDTDYKKLWNDTYEDSVELRDLCRPFTNLDPNSDGKYTGEEFNNIYSDTIPNLQKVVKSIIASQERFNKIKIDLTIKELISTGDVWISDGGIQNPYDKLFFDLENELFIWSFESSTDSFYEVYKMTVLDENTIWVAGVRGDKIPAHISVVDVNKLQVVFLEDVMFNGKALDMSECYLLRTNESADSYIRHGENKEIADEEKCIECGKTATHTYRNPFSGQNEPYCNSHYEEIINIMGKMEDDVESSDQSKHSCEQCSREGTHVYLSFTGQTEYYCTQHYEELLDMLEALGVE